MIILKVKGLLINVKKSSQVLFGRFQKRYPFGILVVHFGYRIFSRYESCKFVLDWLFNWFVRVLMARNRFLFETGTKDFTNVSEPEVFSNK